MGIGRLVIIIKKDVVVKNIYRIILFTKVLSTGLLILDWWFG